MSFTDDFISLFFATTERVGRQLVDRPRGNNVFGPWRDRRDTETGREWSFRALSTAMIDRHLDGTLLYRGERARLQTYGVSDAGESTWTAIDIDVTAGGSHSDQPQHFATTEEAIAAAERVVDEADRVGVAIWLEITKSAGIRGWGFYSSPIPAADANALGQLLVARAGLHAATEVFPNTLRPLAAPVLLPFAGVAPKGRQIILNRETMQPMPCGDFVTAALAARTDTATVSALVNEAVAAGEVKRLSAPSERDRMVVEPVTDEEAERRWKAILAGCARLRMMVEHAEAGRPLDYFDWATRLLPHLRSLGEWGHGEFHRLSAFDPRYNAGECEDKFDSLDGSPTRCEKMGCSRDPHRDCGLPAKNVSPAYFGAVALAAVRESASTDPAPTAAAVIVPVPDDAMFYGVLGRIVNAFIPHTEANAAAIMLSLIIAVGNLIGRKAYQLIEQTRHYCNMNAVIVGPSSTGRKGTAWDIARSVVGKIDTIWAETRILGGLSSGEGLLYAVRDTVLKNGEVVDEGVSDKRLLVIETEFGRCLKVTKREGNTLSALIRQAWDNGNLRVMTKQALIATNGHVSIIAHITPEELRRDLDAIDVLNGFGNRFLWAWSKRSKRLPDGSSVDWEVILPMVEELRAAVDFARAIERVDRDPEARQVWHDVYANLTEDAPGAYGALTARGAPTVVRLSVIFALLDGSVTIRQAHLLAALSVWDYCLQSVRYVFDGQQADPIMEKLMDALRASSSGLTSTEISAIFGHNLTSGEYNNRLHALQKQGLVSRMTEQSSGRPVTRWFATP